MMPCSRQVALTLVGLGLGLACTKPATTSEAPSGEPQPAPAISEREAPMSLDAPRFWIAGGGLRAYDLDGNQVASLGEFGDRAVRLRSGHVIAIGERSERVELALIGPQGEHLVHVELPAALDLDRCEPRALAEGELEALAAAERWDDMPITLMMQSSRDLWLSSDERTVCVELLDRNENMASYGVWVAVDLGAGAALSSGISFDLEETCPEQPRVPACRKRASLDPWIEGPLAAEAGTESWPLRFDPVSGYVLDEAGESVLDLCPLGARDEPEFDPGWTCASMEEQSSSGRWLLLNGLISEGDYIHRDMVILDLETGELSVLVDDGGDDGELRWQPIAAEAVFDDEPEHYPLSVVGESEIAALPEDRLWIDGYLVILARREVVRIGGTRVQTVLEQI